ncbi:MAG TPA: NAD(P)H-binding protein [Bryobacteraceae bacterium]
MPRRIFVTGGTGYVGSRLIPLLIERGHQVTALARPGSEKKIGAGCTICIGNALSGESYRAQVAGHDTFIHLVGVSHPSPAKVREFTEIDLKSAQEAIRVASQAGIRHFIYVSVAQPAPVMKAYVGVRAECERLLGASGLPATILRPWYILGPGHRWPILLKPFYAAAGLIPALREGAQRLGLVSVDQFVRALASAAGEQVSGVRILGVPEIRRFAS